MAIAKTNAKLSPFMTEDIITFEFAIVDNAPVTIEKQIVRFENRINKVAQLYDYNVNPTQNVYIKGYRHFNKRQIVLVK